MPLRVPLARNQATAFSSRQRSRSTFFHPSCPLWPTTVSTPLQTTTPTYPRLARALHSQGRPSTPIRQLSPGLEHVPARYATTLASRTAINPPLNVSGPNRDLYASLERLKDTASDYVNQSRLQLALRGLESETPTLRIGLLGLGSDGDRAARRLARVLLADALGDEGRWEQVLVNGNGNGSGYSGKALLLKYGAEDDIPPLNPLVETVSVPSRVLQRHNLEILITSLNTGAVSTADPAGLVEAMLVPPLLTPVASTGRAGFVRYPVHKTLVVGEGIEGCMDFGRLAASIQDTVLARSGAKERLIQGALSIPRDGARSGEAHAQSDLVSAIDIDQATAALQSLRADVANGPIFNTKWQASNIESVKQALTAEAADSTTNTLLRPALEHHIVSTLDSASAAITQAEVSAHSAKLQKTIPDSTRATIQTAISTWSQHAHTDLQQSLATALASRSWRRTSWSRLLWRVDDVGVAAEAVLRNHWLLDAEAGLAFLSGRVEQAGFFASKSSKANYNPDYALHSSDRAVTKSGESVAGERAYLLPTSSTSSVPATGIETEASGWRTFFSRPVREPTPADLLKFDAVAEKVRQEGGIDIFHSRPWPLSIHFTRQRLLHTLVPSLQSRAQTLLLSALTTIGGTGALGTWIYVATAGVSVAEAGAVAALGLVWSVRRLQKKWEEERAVWESEVRESGRVILAEVEEGMRRIVRENERAELRPEDVAQWAKAREAVREVEAALAKRAA